MPCFDGKGIVKWFLVHHVLSVCCTFYSNYVIEQCCYNLFHKQWSWWFSYIHGSFCVKLWSVRSIYPKYIFSSLKEVTPHPQSVFPLFMPLFFKHCCACLHFRILQMRSSAYYPKYGLGAFGIFPLLLKKRWVPISKTVYMVSPVSWHTKDQMHFIDKTTNPAEYPLKIMVF